MNKQENALRILIAFLFIIMMIGFSEGAGRQSGDFNVTGGNFYQDGTLLCLSNGTNCEFSNQTDLIPWTNNSGTIQPKPGYPRDLLVDTFSTDTILLLTPVDGCDTSDTVDEYTGLTLDCVPISITESQITNLAHSNLTETDVEGMVYDDDNIVNSNWNVSGSGDVDFDNCLFHLDVSQNTMGFGTCSPDNAAVQTFNYNSVAQDPFRMENTANGQIWLFGGGVGGQGQFAIFDLNSFIQRFAITNTGTALINMTGAGFTLIVSDSAGKPGGGTWSDSSDRRLKTKIKNRTISAIDQFMQLPVQEFEFTNPQNHSKGTRVGIMAQDLVKVFPQFVSNIPAWGADKKLAGINGTVMATYYPHDWFALVIKAFQEHEKELQEITDVYEDNVGKVVCILPGERFGVCSTAVNKTGSCGCV